MKNYLIVITIFLAGCGSPRKATSTTPSVSFSPSWINSLAENYFSETLILDPLYATSIGDHRYDDLLEVPLTADHRARVSEMVERYLKQITAQGCVGMNEQDLLTCQALTDDLVAQSQEIKSDLGYLMPVNQFDSFFVDFPDLASGSSYVSFDTKKDYENFLKRMHRIPAYFETMIQNMDLGVKKHVTTPKVLLEKALKQMDGLLVSDYTQSVFYKPLLKLDAVVRKSDQGDLKQRYGDSIKNEIYPAYQKLRTYVHDSYLKNARTSSGLAALPGGKAYYRALARMNTTTDLTPDQIMKLGLSEVKRIRKEFERVKTQLGFKGKLKDFLKAIRVEPKLFPFHSAQEVMTAYEKIHTQVLNRVPEQFNLLPKAKFEIKEVEKFKAEMASESYQNASPDGTRPGIFWVPVPNAPQYSSKDMESLFLHEAIPGHHFQISIQQELQNQPRYRRFAGNNAYVEGWALYSEGLGKDLGMYSDPYQWLGRLSNEMHRAMRLVVDTGIHAKGWSRERAIQYSLENEAYDEAGIISEIERYMAIPGQALSYKVGELKILELKERTKKALGVKYNAREFHAQILKDGALPLSTLDKKFERWFKRVK